MNDGVSGRATEDRKLLTDSGCRNVIESISRQQAQYMACGPHQPLGAALEAARLGHVARVGAGRLPDSRPWKSHTSYQVCIGVLLTQSSVVGAAQGHGDGSQRVSVSWARPHNTIQSLQENS